MAKTGQNFEMFIGDDKNLIFTVEDTETLSGISIKWRLGRNFASEPIIEKTNEPGGGIETEGNEFTVTLKPEDTEDLNPRVVYYHETEFTDGDGNVFTVATGSGKFYPTF